MGADTSRFELYLMEEVTFGVTPAIALDEIRMTGEGLRQVTETAESDEIRGDRQNSDVIRTSAMAEGDVNHELIYANPDKMFEGIMMNAFDGELTIASSAIDAASADDSFNSTALFGSVVAGQWIKVAGFVDPANNGFFRVKTATASKLVVDATLVLEAAGPAVTIDGNRLVNGVTLKSYTLEKRSLDTTQFFSYKGCRFGTMSLQVAVAAMINGTFGITGISETIAGVTVGTGPDVAAPTNQVMNSVDHVLNLQEGNITPGFDISEFTLNMDNKVRADQIVGQLGPKMIGIGTISLTGTLVAYFIDEILMEKYLNFDSSAISMRLQDTAGNAYVLTLPRIKYTSGQVIAGGKDQPTLAQMEWASKLDDDSVDPSNVTIQIDKFSA